MYMVFCAFITIIIVISVCVDTIEPIQYGVKYDTISKKIDESKVYDSGWYFLSPNENFIIFPRTQVNLDFTEFADAGAAPLNIKDSQGQEIKFQFSLQYKLHKEELG